MADVPDMTPLNEGSDQIDSDSRKRKLSLRTKLAFSSGSLQEATVTAAGLTTMIFYNQVLGLSPGLCGIAFMIASIVDGISDPLVGAISDRYGSRWGRRHPFMFVAAFPLGTADQIPYLHQVRKERIEYKAYFKELLQLIVNPSYAAVCVSWLTVSMALSIMGMVGTYTYV